MYPFVVTSPQWVNVTSNNDQRHFDSDTNTLQVCCRLYEIQIKFWGRLNLEENWKICRSECQNMWCFVVSCSQCVNVTSNNDQRHCHSDRHHAVGWLQTIWNRDNILRKIKFVNLKVDRRGMYKTWPGLAWPGLSWPVKNIICLWYCEIPPTIKWCFFSNVSYRMESYFSYQWVNPSCIPWLVLTDLNNGLMNCLWYKDWKVFHLAIIIAHINSSVLKRIDCFLFSLIITFNMPT